MHLPIDSPSRLLIAMISPITVMTMFCIILALSDFRLEYCPHEPCYCENRTSTSIVAQPANAWSTMAFVVVSFIIAFHSALMVKTKSKVIELICWSFSTAFLGPGSLVFHAYYTFWGEILDASSMYIFLSVVIASEINRRLVDDNNLIYILIVVVLSSITCSSEAWLYDGQKEWVFVALIALYIVISLIPYRDRPYCKSRIFFFTGMVIMIAAVLIWWFSRTDDSSLCDESILFTGHAIWHILTSIVVLFLYFHLTPYKRFDPNPQETTDTQKTNTQGVGNTWVDLYA